MTLAMVWIGGIDSNHNLAERSINDFSIANNPNVIVILTDDMGFADVGFNGCKDIPTPNIDRIANEGVKFTNAYVTYPVCGPSRAGIITGRYQDRFGFGRNPLFAVKDVEMGLPLEEETLAEMLKKAGYNSTAIGKWHLGAHPALRPLNRGFDAFFGFLSGGHQYFPDALTLQDEYDVKAQFDAYKTKLLRNNTRINEKEYLTDAFSREAVNAIERNKDNAFFIYLAYNAPHTPLQATEKYLKRFESIKDEKRRTYAAMVSAVDDGVGLILNKLEELDIAENTIIFFLSDNGGPEATNGSDNGILRGGKSELFDGGIHVPFAMRWPAKIKKSLTYEAPIISLDIAGTVLSQFNPQIQIKNPLDGVNLIPFLLKEQQGAPHEHLYWRKFDQNQYACLASNGEKLAFIKNEEMFFNLSKDPSESRNIKEQNSKSEALKSIFEMWRAAMKDPVFMGLESDKAYNELHPERYLKDK